MSTKENIEKIFKKHQSYFGELDIDSCIDDIVSFIDEPKQLISNVTTCPICKGNGIVDSGFYTQTSGYWISNGSSNTQCKSCYGKGYVKY